MPRSTDVEVAALGSGTQNTLFRLLWALAVVWAPTVLAYLLIVMSGVEFASDHTRPGEAVGETANEPGGGLTAVLFIPLATVAEFGAMWWGIAIWLQERRKRSGHRRRRRKPLEKFLQRLAFGVVALSVVVNLPFFAWFLLRYWQLSVRF